MPTYYDKKEGKRFRIIPEPPDNRGRDKNTEREQKRRRRQLGLDGADGE